MRYYLDTEFDETEDRVDNTMHVIINGAALRWLT